MNKKVNEILKAWDNKQGENLDVYPAERIVEIATNCVSLSEAWLDRVRGTKNLSLEMYLFDKDDILCDTLYGINMDNLAETMFDILLNKHENFSKMVLNSFTAKDGKKTSYPIGELEIS